MIIRELLISIRSTIVLWLITALVYPFLILMIGQTLFPMQANGSLLTNAQGQIIGSALIGQNFTTDSYFHSRPSVINYSEGEAASPTGISGGSNLAPSNPDLIERIKTTVNDLKQTGVPPTADLVYTSGSGLDPHISPEAAFAQISRVSQSRSVTPQELEQLIQQNTQGRFLSIFGEPTVNVLKLNLALDSLSSK